MKFLDTGGSFLHMLCIIMFQWDKAYSNMVLFQVYYLLRLP
ncbi:Uncharacterized protein dnl_19140 [Desulfonema limicola]|uniref:Uncharacterized protein n=1 Tax=Desulfonema limicola TaxID=45656 RepID=A0A975B6B9_9BACT|nr:Uncharacterized protein dnl_19140 [Desulfonema limicola]